MLFVLIPSPSPKNRRFLELGGGILFKKGHYRAGTRGLHPALSNVTPPGFCAVLLFRRNGLQAIKRCCILSAVATALNDADT